MKKVNKNIALTIITITMIILSACTKTDIKNGISDTAIKENSFNTGYVQAVNVMCNMPGATSPACDNK